MGNTTAFAGRETRWPVQTAPRLTRRGIVVDECHDYRPDGKRCDCLSFPKRGYLKGDRP